VTVGIERDECVPKIHRGWRLRDFQAARFPGLVGRMHRIGVGNGKRNFAAAGLSVEPAADSGCR
jgi:hypothetical protein